MEAMAYVIRYISSQSSRIAHARLILLSGQVPGTDGAIARCRGRVLGRRGRVSTFQTIIGVFYYVNLRLVCHTSTYNHLPLIIHIHCSLFLSSLVVIIVVYSADILISVKQEK